MLLFIFSLVFAYAIYLIFFKPTLYWKKKGVVYINPWIAYIRLLFTRKSFIDAIMDTYNTFENKRYYGGYQLFKPALFVKDPDLIKRITVQDFDHFPDHMNIVNEKLEPVLSYNLFSLRGEKWKDMRSMLSPAFTSAKMRHMYSLMQESAENFVKYFSSNENDVIEVEMKDIASRFTNDVIASCAFGIQCNSFKNGDNQFYKTGKFLLFPKGFTALRGMLSVFFPAIYKIFRFPAFPPEVTEFFRNIVKTTIAAREENNIIRPDMIHLLMEARKGRLKHEKETKEPDVGFATVEEMSPEKSPEKYTGKIQLTDDIIAAQGLVFFIAGLDISASVLTFLSYELALNPDVQAKLQQEIDDVMKDGSSVTYEEILKMKYLDQVISEGLRKYPPGFVLNRACSKDYKIKAIREDEVDLVLDKGCLVTIPAISIQRDPKWFPEPDKFDPERFSDENKSKIVSGTYMPFGIGPRNCIASRFGLLEAKLHTVYLLANFDVVSVKRTPIPLMFGKTLNITAKGGAWVGLKKRNK